MFLIVHLSSISAYRTSTFRVPGDTAHHARKSLFKPAALCASGQLPPRKSCRAHDRLWRFVGVFCRVWAGLVMPCTFGVILLVGAEVGRGALRVASCSWHHAI